MKMNRILWGLIKVAILVGLLVWVSREFFPATPTEEIPNSETSIEELTEVDVVSSKDSEEKKQETQMPVVTRSSAPTTTQQKMYTNFSAKAGMPETFTVSFTAQRAIPLSMQLARALGEPEGNWEDLSVHKKTFWVLSELALRDINVDAARSLNGMQVEILWGKITIDLSDVAVAPVAAQSMGAVVPSAVISIPTVDAGQIDSEIPAKKTMRRMSARAWKQVLETGSRRKSF